MFVLIMIGAVCWVIADWDRIVNAVALITASAVIRPTPIPMSPWNSQTGRADHGGAAEDVAARADAAEIGLGSATARS